MIPPTKVETKRTRKEGDSRLSLRIHLQDGSYRMISTHKKHTGYELLLQCSDEMGCKSPQYFNLCRSTEQGVDRWLDLNLTLDSLGLEEGDSVHFKIKYFKQPAHKLDAVSLQLFFVQTKRSILSGNFIVPERIALLLAAFQLQIFYGSYDPAASWLPGLADNLQEFLPADHLSTADSAQWSHRIIHYYQYLYDLSVNEATYGYLEVARRVPACAAVLFPVLQGKLHVTIGIVEDGVIFFKDDKKSQFEFFSFDDLLAWANAESGVALRLQKRNLITAPPSGNLQDNQQVVHEDYFQMRVSYDCTEDQAMTIIDLLEGYNFLLSRESQERQQMLISEGLRPIAGASEYLAPSRRVQDEPFGSKLDHFLNAYRVACSTEHVSSFAPLLSLVDQLDFPGTISELNLSSCGMDSSASLALLHAVDNAQKYRSSVGDRSVTHNFEITSVDVSGNRVSPLFPSIASFAPTITSLDLSRNSFAKEDLTTFANAFKGANSLVKLYLAETELSDKTLSAIIPHLFKCNALQTLDLSTNALKGATVCAELGRLVKALPRFEALSLQRNKLSDSSIESFVQALLDGGSSTTHASNSSTSTPATHPNQTSGLNLSSSSQPNASSSLSPAIGGGTSGNASSNSSPRSTSSSNASSALPTPLARSPVPSGYHFDFSYTGAASKAVAALASLIKRDKSVRVLRLAGTGLSSSSALSDALKEDARLLILDVGGSDFGKKGWLELFSGLAKQSDVCRFDATEGLDKYGWHGLRIFAREVESRLTHLKFKQCAISSQALSCFTDIFTHQQCFVNTLVMKGSTFGKKDLASFCDILAKTTSLTHLDLSACKLDNTSSSALARSLKGNVSIVSFILDGNLLSDSAIEELAENISENTSLERLSLRKNLLTPECLPYWSNCISNNCILQTIDLRLNGIVLDEPTKALLRSVPCAAEILL